MLSRELLYFKYLGFKIQLKPEQRKSIINLLRGEDAGYRDSSYGIRKSFFIVQLYILKGGNVKLDAKILLPPP
jgi:hypothetical protein